MGVANLVPRFVVTVKTKEYGWTPTETARNESYGKNRFAFWVKRMGRKHTVRLDEIIAGGNIRMVDIFMPESGGAK